MNLLLVLIITALFPLPLKNSSQNTSYMGYYGSNNSTVTATIDSFYKSLSYSSGNQPDWNTFQNLFIRGARLIHVNNDKYTSMSIRAFENKIKQKIKNGLLKSYKESQISQKIARYGKIVQVFSKYKSSFSTTNGRTKGIGINSFSLMRSHDRWWIVSILWDAKGSGNPISPHFIPAMNKLP